MSDWYEFSKGCPWRLSIPSKCSALVDASGRYRPCEQENCAPYHFASQMMIVQAKNFTAGSSEEFATLVKTARRRKRLTLRALSERTGLLISELSDIESFRCSADTVAEKLLTEALDL